MKNVDNYIKEKNIDEALNTCLQSNLNNLGILISYISKKSLYIDDFKKNKDFEKNNIYRIQLLSNWASTQFLKEWYSKMSIGGKGSWNKLLLVTENPDFWVIFNSPPKDAVFDSSKTIVFQMEPHMNGVNKWRWGNWASPDHQKFLKVCTHDRVYNNLEWHLKKTYNQLKCEKIQKKYNSLSTVLSYKYNDPGHIKRVDFVKFLDSKNFNISVYGSNKWKYKNYKGSLPPFNKNDGLIPYKYTFNCENNSIPNYVTEKLIDGILAECLTFYSGCPNIKNIIDEKAYVYLELEDFDKDYQTIVRMIQEGEWEKRIEHIRKVKHYILDNLQFFPRIENILNGNKIN
jgi:hypothetical protein